MPQKSSQISTCVNAEFGAYVRFQMGRLEQGLLDLETPCAPKGYEEYESRFFMALLGSIDDEMKRGVVESALGQAVPSFQLLIAVLEKFQPGETEERASLIRFLRNLPAAIYNETPAACNPTNYSPTPPITSAAQDAYSAKQPCQKPGMQRAHSERSVRFDQAEARAPKLNSYDERVSLMITLIE